MEIRRYGGTEDCDLLTMKLLRECWVVDNGPK